MCKETVQAFHLYCVIRDTSTREPGVLAQGGTMEGHS